ncbi:MAG TPA: hypothetical protein VLE97_10720 [Gaiellaceae bacterium]|nr:hypothetical protein [Gaiellaceae bacterium]
MTTMTGTEREVIGKLRLYGSLVYAHQTPGTQVALVALRNRGLVAFTAPDGAATIATLAATLPTGQVRP